MSDKSLCISLKKFIDEESKGYQDYLKFYRVASIVNGSASGLRSKVLAIMKDESQHQEILKDAYKKRCRR